MQILHEKFGIEVLRNRLGELEEEIAETKKRLPAHSVKPPVMMDLLALEDEYDEILEEMKQLRQATTNTKTQKSGS